MDHNFDHNADDLMKALAELNSEQYNLTLGRGHGEASFVDDDIHQG